MKINISLDLANIRQDQRDKLLGVLYGIEDTLQYKCKSVSRSIDKIQDYSSFDYADIERIRELYCNSDYCDYIEVLKLMESKYRSTFIRLVYKAVKHLKMWFTAKDFINGNVEFEDSQDYFDFASYIIYEFAEEMTFKIWKE